MLSQDPFENPGFAQCVTSIVEERLAVYQGSSVDAAIEPLPSSFSESPRPSMNLDTAYLGLTTASTDIFPSDVDRTDSPTLPSPEPPQAVSALCLKSPREHLWYLLMPWQGFTVYADLCQWHENDSIQT